MNCSCQSSGGDSPSTTISHAPRKDASHRVTSPRAAAKEIALHYYQLQFCCRQRAAGGTGRSTNQPTPCPSPFLSLLCCCWQKPVLHTRCATQDNNSKRGSHKIEITCFTYNLPRQKAHAKQKAQQKRRWRKGDREQEGAGGGGREVAACRCLINLPKAKRQKADKQQQQQTEAAAAKLSTEKGLNCQLPWGM